LVGPTGLAFDAARDTLYVASTADNGVYAIPKAATTGFRQGKGNLVVQDDAHLHGPLGLALAPNGDLIVSNGDAVNQDPNQLNELEVINSISAGGLSHEVPRCLDQSDRPGEPGASVAARAL
jgi:sugar lactone lactonase YvrE